MNKLLEKTSYLDTFPSIFSNPDYLIISSKAQTSLIL